MIDFFANEYNEKTWNGYVKNFENLDIKIDDIPKDIVNVLCEILGYNTAYKWLHSPLNKFEGMNASELLKIPKGEKALKAFIMRMPI